MVAGCTLGKDACHWMLYKRSTWFKVKKKKEKRFKVNKMAFQELMKLWMTETR